MYSKFNYTPGTYFYHTPSSNYVDSGNKLYESSKQLSKDFLNKFLLDNKSIDGTAIKDHWFKVEETDVFLSHSHDDIEEVKAFAGWLYDNFGLTSFIDSCVWGYCDELLKIIDNTYCINKDGATYNYKLRNYSTSHVHAMLSAAISEMIDKAECVIFFNTPNSIALKDEINNVKAGNDNSEYTKSPWIYHELSMTHLIKSTLPSRLEPQRSSTESFNESFLMKHKVDEYLTEMKSLTDANLQQWSNNHNSQMSGEYALDELYRIVDGNKKS